MLIVILFRSCPRCHAGDLILRTVPPSAGDDGRDIVCVQCGWSRDWPLAGLRRAA